MTSEQDKSKSQIILNNSTVGSFRANNIIQCIFNVVFAPLKKEHKNFILLVFFGIGITLIVAGFKILFTDNVFTFQVKQLLSLGGLVITSICIFYALFWNPNENYNNKENKVLSVRPWKIIASVGMFGIPLSIVAGIYFWMNAPTHTIVTFATYSVEKDDPNQYLVEHLTTSISERLTKDTDITNKQDVEIKQLKKSFKYGEEKEARDEAKQRRATISMWGYYVTPDKKGLGPVTVSSVIEILNQALVTFFSKDKYEDWETRITQDGFRPSELKNINIINNNNKPEISQMLAYYTNFIAGVAEYKSGLDHCKAKKVTEAKDSFDNSIEHLKSAINNFNTKNIQKNNDKLDRFLVDFLRSIPNFYSGNTFLYKAYCSKQLQDYDLAINSFTEASKSIDYVLESENRQNYYAVEYPYSLIPVNYYSEEDRPCGNKRDKNVKVSNSPDGFKILLSRIYYNRGIAYAMKGKNEKALDDFQKAIKLDSETNEFCIGLGSAYAELRNPELAIRNYNNAIGKIPDTEDSLVYYNMGNIYFREGRYGRAIGEYLKAITLDLNFSKAYNNLTIAILKTVCNAWEDMRHVFPSWKDVNDALKWYLRNPKAVPGTAPHMPKLPPIRV